MSIRFARLGLIAAFAFATLAIGQFSSPARADLKALQEAAEKEGTLTWYTAHTNAETAETVGRAFTALYPKIKVNVIRTTAQVAYQRLSQDIKNKTPNCDVFSSTDLGHYATLKPQNKFAKFVPDNAGRLGKDYQGLDPDGYFYPTTAFLVLINYNTQKVKPEDAPKKWTDLLDPKWNGKVTVGHPAFSGAVGTWVMTMKKLYGWDFFTQLEKGKPQIGRSIVDTVTMLNSGERVVGAGPSATTLQSAEKGNPLAIVYPEDGTVIIVAPSAVMADAPHPNAARLFMEFLLGPEHAEVSAKDGNESLRPEVKSVMKGLKPLSEVKVLRPTVEEAQKGIPEVIEQWRDTFGN